MTPAVSMSQQQRDREAVRLLGRIIRGGSASTGHAERRREEIVSGRRHCSATYLERLRAWHG